MFDDIPPWVLFAVPAGVIVLALMSRNSGGGTPYGAVTAYQPTPADPGLVSLAQSEVSARAGAVNTLASIMGAEEISRIAANRDVQLSTIQASVANARTEAERQAALAHENTSQLVGVAQTDAAAAVAMAETRTRAQIANTQAAAATSQAHIQAKAGILPTIVNGITSFFSHIPL
ncbi:MAG TPA: hypothetical protein VGO07_03755 [Candidatus Saccharimonadales bacterium]|jgi:hypothetical protein|nr:hypothetical protein [Candidatus Saccharimonadales bacterium]